jgi:UDP-sugar pyrophosphorylase
VDIIAKILPLCRLLDLSSMTTAPALPKYFTEAISVLSEPHQTLCKQLYSEWGQAHLFDEGHFNADSPPSMRRQLAAQLDALDQDYISGGLRGYIANARLLMNDSRNGVNPLEGWKPMVPVGESFDLGTDAYKETEALGMNELGRVGFVLVAGGLGERLGYKDIKVCCVTLNMDSIVRAPINSLSTWSPF